MVRILVLILLLPISQALGEEDSYKLPETVVSASRVETNIEETGRNIAVRTSNDFKTQQIYSLTDALQTVPGLRMTNIGGPGSPGVTPIEIRGFRNSGTQLLFNGLRLNDPSSPAGTGESIFSYLTTTGLKTVEVLRGATGVNYGSDGQAGAVNLLPLSPQQGVSLDGSVRGGSFGTLQSDATLNYGEEEIAAVASVTRIDSDGLDTHGNYENTTAMANLRVELNEQISLEPLFRFTNAINDLDTSPILGDDGNLITNQDTEFNHAGARSLFFGVVSNYINEGFSSRLALYGNNAKRDYFFDFGGFISESDFEGSSYNADWQNSIKIPQLLSTVVTGVEFEHQTIDNNSDGLENDGQQDRIAFFLRNRVALLDESLVFDGGVRVTHVSAISRTLPTLELAGTYKLTELGTRFHSSIAQGFRAPTLFESRGVIVDYSTGLPADVGNGSLEEEQSLSFDIGVAQKILDDSLELDVTFFNIDADQTIVFDFANLTHRNAGSGQFQGIETSLTAQPLDKLLIRAAYTYQDKASAGDYQRLQRRPYNIYALSAAYRFNQIEAFLEGRYRGSQLLDFYGESERFKESDYFVVDAALNYDLSKEWQIFARVDNIFDKDYTDGGFSMPGISAQGGLRFKI